MTGPEAVPGGAGVDLIPAATVIPLRDRPGGGFEVLMLRRNARGSFGGMWVFPGGRVDPEDDDPANPYDDLAAARRAAAREAVEEADLLVEPGEMVPYSHWTPPIVAINANKRYATWFFVCRAPVGEAGEVTVDGGEIHEDEWVVPTEMLARRDAGEIQLAPPTIVTLHDLARHDDVAAVLADAGDREPFPYFTRILVDDGGLVALWQGDAGYEVADDAAALAVDPPHHRLDMRPDAWLFHDDVVLGLR